METSKMSDDYGFRGNKKLTWLAVLLSILVPGLGQIYNGQTVKGIVLLLLAVVGGSITCGIAYFPVWVIAVVDAALIADKINRGIHVGEWDFF
jgi:TM2 domain-containing membrane protein YozV